MKYIFYHNMNEFLNDKTKEQTDLAVVKRNGYIDIDCFIEAKSEYMAFKKVAIELAKHGYDSLINDLKYKDEFLSAFKDEYMRELYEYPDEKNNGYYGYSIEAYDGWYYVRHFEPII